MPLGGFAPLPLRLGGSALEGISPEQHARLCADLLAVRRTTPLFETTYTKAGSVFTLHAYRGMNGEGAAFAPTLSSDGNGKTRFTFATSSFVDQYGVDYPFAIRAVLARAHGSVATDAVGFPFSTSFQLIVTTHDAAGVAADAKVSVRAW